MMISKSQDISFTYMVLSTFLLVVEIICKHDHPATRSPHIWETVLESTTLNKRLQLISEIIFIQDASHSSAFT